MNINLQDPTNFTTGSPYEVFRHLRENDPVHWQEETDGPGFWALTRYADCKAASLDASKFSNFPTCSVSDKAVYGDETHQQLMFCDAPRHTAHRKLLSPELSLTRIRPAEEGMSRLVDSIVDMVIEDGEADLVTDLSGKMASYAIADLLGLEREHSLAMFHAVEILASRPISTSDGVGAEAFAVVSARSREAWEERTQTSRDDALSRIITGEIMGVPYDAEQFAIDFQLLVGAGSDTSRNVLATGMITLLEHPEARSAILRDPSIMPQVLEELLRYSPPIYQMRRTAAEDFSIGDQPIRRGDKIVLYYGAANRDPAVFEDPDTFDYTRKPNPHITFGAGRHHCLGSHLARMELTTMFLAMLRRMPDMELAGDVVWPELEEVPMVGGPESIPVRFTPGTRIIDAEVEPIFA